MVMAWIVVLGYSLVLLLLLAGIFLVLWNLTVPRTFGGPSLSFGASLRLLLMIWTVLAGPLLVLVVFN